MRAGAVADLVGDDRLEVERGHLLLAVGDLLEGLEGVVQRLPFDLEAQLLQGVAQGVAAGVLAQHDRVRLQADFGRVHDLVGAALLQDTVLVDPGLMREGVAPDHGLVRLHRVAGQAADHAAGAGDLPRDDAGAQAVDGARLDHDDAVGGRQESQVEVPTAGGHAK